TAPPQSSNAGRSGGAGGLLGGAERLADRGVGKVIAVAQHDRGALLRRQPVREGLELLPRGTLGLAVRRRLGHIVEADLAALAAEVVHRHPRRDREDPRPQVLAVLEAPIRPQGAKEGLLPRVLGALAEQAAKVP